MKKKALAGNATSAKIIAPEILDMAKQSITPQSVKAPKPCFVCGSTSTPPPTTQGAAAPEEEDLCWVCRRLKISAWRETEQLSAQE